MAGCWDEIKLTAPDIVRYLEDKTGKKYDPETKAGREEFIKAAEEFKKETVEDLSDLHSQLKGEKESPTAVIMAKENNPPEVLVNEPPKPPKDQIQPSGESDHEYTKMANAINDAHIEGKFGAKALDDIINKLQDTRLKEIYEKVKSKIQSGVINLKNMRERLMTTKAGSEEDQAALLYDLAELKGREAGLTKEINLEADAAKVKELQQQLMGVQNEMMDNALANRYIGRSASTIFRIRQLWVNKEKNIVDMTEEFKAAKGIKDLTPEQEKYIKDRYNLIRESKAKLEQAREELDKAIEENAKLKEENKRLEELKGKTATQKKADRKTKSDEAIVKSNERIKKSKDNLKDIINKTKNAGIVPKDDPFLAPKIVAEIANIAAEKVYQGVVKFDTLVRDVWDEIKDILPDWTEMDVINHLLTTRDKAGNLIPSLTSEAYLKSKKLPDRSNANYREKVRAYEAAQKDVALKQYEWVKERRIDMMKARPMMERITDSVLRWQRFAVLSYPSTMVKLAAVVAHQLTLKPLKFATQGMLNLLTPKSVSSKQAIWGSPKWSSLSKYYSTFIKNFALANLKEHFSGIDTKELLYGDKMVYDEWNAANGLLEMPGRSHGYVKSFIKSPEFTFAHEQQINFNITRMAEIQKELDRTDLSKAQREGLEKQYDNYDVTNEDVMERVNKLSLEHGKWSILMNDNKFVSKFQQFVKDNGIAGALVKSEIPIVKIPTNYIGRYFALKYGLIRAIIGKPKWEGRENNYPGIAQLLIKGTKDLTNEQADLLGRALTVGSFGAGLFGFGYMIRNQVKKNDDGSAEVAGVHISKNLTHSPEIESLFSGADMAEYKKGDKDFIAAFVENDIETMSKNPFLQTLQYGFISSTAKAMGSLIKGKDAGDLDKFEEKETEAIARKVTDMAVPGFIKQPAQWIDTKEKGWHPMGEVNKRYPTSDKLMERFWQQIELALPVLRTNVPVYIPKAKGGDTPKEDKAKEDKATEEKPTF